MRLRPLPFPLVLLPPLELLITITLIIMNDRTHLRLQRRVRPVRGRCWSTARAGHRHSCTMESIFWMPPSRCGHIDGPWPVWDHWQRTTLFVGRGCDFSIGVFLSRPGSLVPLGSLAEAPLGWHRAGNSTQFCPLSSAGKLKLYHGFGGMYLNHWNENNIYGCVKICVKEHYLSILNR